MGFGYLAGVLIGAAAAFYLSFTTPLGWVFGSGLFALAIAWTVTTGMAFRAINSRAIVQHREWMIRSYVVTLAFVFFRIVVAVTEIQGDRHRDRTSRRGGVVLLGRCRCAHRGGVLQWRKVKA